MDKDNNIVRIELLRGNVVTEQHIIALKDQADGKHTAEAVAPGPEDPSEEKGVTLTSDESVKIHQLVEDINRNVSNIDYKVSDAIARIPLNSNYVRKQFRETYYMTPVSYMNHLRITQAKSLLLTSDEPISELALHCGFADAKYFTRLFHSSTGYAPLEYRKTYQKMQKEAGK